MKKVYRRPYFAPKVLLFFETVVLPKCVRRPSPVARSELHRRRPKSPILCNRRSGHLCAVRGAVASRMGRMLDLFRGLRRMGECGCFRCYADLAAERVAEQDAVCHAATPKVGRDLSAEHREYPSTRGRKQGSVWRGVFGAPVLTGYRSCRTRVLFNPLKTTGVFPSASRLARSILLQKTQTQTPTPTYTHTPGHVPPRRTTHPPCRGWGPP